MALYDDFAWFYNRYWNDEFHGAAFPILERIWLPRVRAGGRLLDVCCGTGHLARLLTGRGYHVTGIDASESMIAHARENVPQAEFHVADASTFHVPGRFDGAVSTFDSVNHILDPEALDSAFVRVAKSLKKNAPFAFDVLLESAYRTNWADSFTIVHDDHVLLITGTDFDIRTRLAQCRITMFRLLDGAWRRTDAQVVERCYTTQEVDSALDRAGFTGTSYFDAGDLGMKGQIGQGRTFVITSKG